MPVAVAKTNASKSSGVLYQSLKLDSLGLSREAFKYAISGMEKLEEAGKLSNADLITIVDFSLPSSKKRLFVIDLKNGKVLFNTLVSHGRNSGAAVATEFSNAPESFKSSLGFYITGETYKGEHGYSLRLQGEEAGINDNALSRGIVMHSAAYVNDKLVRLQGYIGRSLGCPAIPEKVHKLIIEEIRNGTCLFLYSPDKYYMAHSKMFEQDTTIA
ncbi:L,D-transpeptidase catalytic domain [Chitinophaga sp. CF118]|nr:L,D-transpeptidase catalytic domain [Chitinophaga sp. CF118]